MATDLKSGQSILLKYPGGTPPGKARGIPKEMWKIVEKEIKENGWSWGEIKRWAQDGHHWQSLVKALCVKLRGEED